MSEVLKTPNNAWDSEKSQSNAWGYYKGKQQDTNVSKTLKITKEKENKLIN